MFKFLFISGRKSYILTLTNNCKLNFVYNSVLKAFENNVDVSTFIFQEAVTQEELIILIQNFW
jgi:hypothetical protein